MREFALAIALTIAVCAAPAAAQGPVPDSLLSSTLTRAQEGELNRRLSRLQQRFDALAQQSDLRAGAVRNLAISIFGSDPDLEFETYVRLIDDGARELRNYLTDARGRTDADPVVAALRAQAITAAEDGRLGEARALYLQIISANRSVRERARYAEDLADAADLAEAARLAQASSEYLVAAQQYAEAAALAPENAREKWVYTIARAAAFFYHGQLFDDDAHLAQAVTVYEEALAVRPREVSPMDWADTQNSLGVALMVQAERGAPGALERAVIAYEGALSVFSPSANPTAWALTQTNLSRTLRTLATRGDQTALTRAAGALEAALSVRNRQTDPYGWAYTAYELAVTYRDAGRIAEARAIAEQVREAYLEVGDTYWPGYVARFIARLPQH